MIQCVSLNISEAAPQKTDGGRATSPTPGAASGTWRGLDGSLHRLIYGGASGSDQLLCRPSGALLHEKVLPSKEEKTKR